MQFGAVEKIVLLFLFAQLLALWAGVSLIGAAKQAPELYDLSVSPTKNPEDPLNSAYFLLMVIAGAAGIMLVLRFYHGKFLFRMLEFFVVSSTCFTLAFGILLSLGIFTLETALALAGLFGFLAGASKFFILRLKNFAAVLSSAGFGALFGFSAGLLPAILFVIGISVYDYVAVFKTRHMLAMSRALGSGSLSFTITASSHKQSQIPKEEVRAPASVKLLSKPPMPSSSSQVRPTDEEERLDLGTGDLAVPAMLAVSAYPVAGIAGSAAVIAGSTVSLYFLLHFVLSKRVALPAMPPISLGALSALLLAILLGA